MSSKLHVCDRRDRDAPVAVVSAFTRGGKHIEGFGNWVDTLVRAIIHMAHSRSMLSLDFQVRASLPSCSSAWCVARSARWWSATAWPFSSDALARHRHSRAWRWGYLSRSSRASPARSFVVDHAHHGRLRRRRGPAHRLCAGTNGPAQRYRHRRVLRSALGLGGIFVGAANRQVLNSKQFMFGDPLLVESGDLLWLLLLIVITLVFLIFYYNPLVFGSFNESLQPQVAARARRQARYLFIVLLALVVNLCQQTVGILLINGLLIVPGAAAANLSRNFRQLLWLSLAVFPLLCGRWPLFQLRDHVATNQQIQVGVGGMVVFLNVALFILSMALRPWVEAGVETRARLACFPAPKFRQ